MTNDTTQSELKQTALSISKTRGKNRQKLLRSFSLKVIDSFKEKGLLSFPRSYINDVCSSITANSTQDKIVTEVLNTLLLDKKIKPIVITKPIYTFRNKTLQSADFDSYAVLMARNGYKRQLFKRTGLNRVKVGELSINETLPDNEIINPLLDEIQEVYNETEINSYKPQSAQGCYNNGRFSVVKDFCFYSHKTIYSIE